jgi:hypothetical protein
MTITLLAAPIIVRLPAIVDPAAKASIAAGERDAEVITGSNNAMNGTLEMNCEITTLNRMIIGIEDRKERFITD